MLGVMYLLKLRHGDDFCTMVGIQLEIDLCLCSNAMVEQVSGDTVGTAWCGADGASSVMPRRHLRAVSLVDARAYAL